MVFYFVNRLVLLGKTRPWKSLCKFLWMWTPEFYCLLRIYFCIFSVIDHTTTFTMLSPFDLLLMHSIALLFRPAMPMAFTVFHCMTRLVSFFFCFCRAIKIVQNYHVHKAIVKSQHVYSHTRTHVKVLFG